MSRIAVQNPVIHTPAFKEFSISGDEFKAKIEALGIGLPVGVFDSTYYYTNPEGWAKLIPDLLIKSDLAKKEKFDCENFAMKAMIICHERYGLNAFGLALGNSMYGYHAFNILYDGMGFWLFEPNAGAGYGDTIFRIGDNYYQPDRVIV